MTIKTVGPDATDRVPTNAAEAGNFSIAHRGAITVAALAANEVVAVSRIPKGADVYGLHYSHEALGATTALKFGYVPVDGSAAAVDDAFKAAAASTSAGVGWLACAPFTSQTDLYVIATQTGAGSGSGKITARALYVFTNSVP